MTKRNYTSTVRADIAAEKRGKTIEAAAQFFREPDSNTTFSLDLVAKSAGVTRLTVYNQFGSRAGLLEAVFDDLALKGGILRLSEVKNMASPVEALDRLIDIFCEFWSSDVALARLYDAMSTDQEIAQQLEERVKRGRQVIAHVVGLFGPNAGNQARRDAADMIFTLTGLPTYRVLAESRSADKVGALIKLACADAVQRMLNPRH